MMKQMNDRIETKGLTLKEKFGAFSVLCASVYLIAISIFPVMYNLTGEFETMDFVLNAILLVIGTGSLFGGIRFIKKSILFEHLLDLGFEKGIYARLEPILNDIVASQVAMNDVAAQLKYMNTNIDRLRDRPQSQGAEVVDVRTEIFRFLRLVLLVNVTLAVFVYLLRAYGPIIPYVMAALFILWWAEITFEFRLWSNQSIWVWVFVPILVIPITTILTDLLYSDVVMVGVTSVVLVIYVSLYYMWGRYLVERTLPFGLSEYLGQVDKVRGGALSADRFSKVRGVLARVRAYMNKRARPFSLAFFATSGSLLLLALYTIACMAGVLQSPAPITTDQLALVGMHVLIFASVGRKLWRKSVKNMERGGTKSATAKDSGL